MTDRESFDYGVEKFTRLINYMINEPSDPESYNMFYKLLGGVNAIYAVLSNEGEISIDNIQDQIFLETAQLLNGEEQ
ncbi:hypothetical protein G166_gp36 [Clostridium phage phi8074-B1]|uniref:hypothetical protein n=1 Tax=Clostridium phage phi8074-B1 TaxID=1147137 RepID=UPI00025C0C57|nr:hypothetical protein G166_gp36 [Clostridium phage phi8074-B1]AFC61968.1 hypothetical protein phi8074-B1_00036 [Clostridium phage phi8074-B1]